MPERAPAACRRPGCPGLVRSGVCSVCGPLRTATNREHDERRGTAQERGYDGLWQRVRAMHLNAHPLCRMCLDHGRVTPATLVDHVVPIVDGGARLDDDNLQSLCVECHARKTAQDLVRRQAR